MVNLKGKGSMSGKNLLVVAYDSSIGKGDGGKLNFLDVQLDHRDPAGPGQSNLHATSKQSKNKDGSAMTKNGKQLYDHNVNYYDKQLDAIKEAAGPNTEPLLTNEGEPVGTVYAVKGNLMSNPRGPGLMVNTKEGQLEQSELPKIGPDTMKAQYDSASAASAEARAAKAAQKEEPAAEAAKAEPAVESAEASADEPAFG